VTTPGEAWARLPGGLVVHRTGPAHYAGLEELQRVVFPTLADEQRFKAPHYARHVALFPDGQFCVVDHERERVVGMTSTIRYDFDFAHPDHTFAQMIAGGWLTSHQPDGRWLYGADVGTHPDYRGRGIARALYAARHDTVRRLGLAGQVTVGMPSGYGALAATMRAEDYYAELLAGTRRDPTLSMQMNIGFQPRGLIARYIDDPVCAGYGVVLVLPAATPVPFERAP
jgi:GNAT superfamily N-acetyltransferase